VRLEHFPGHRRPEPAFLRVRLLRRALGERAGHGAVTVEVVYRHVARPGRARRLEGGALQRREELGPLVVRRVQRLVHDRRAAGCVRRLPGVRDVGRDDLDIGGHQAWPLAAPVDGANRMSALDQRARRPDAHRPGAEDDMEF